MHLVTIYRTNENVGQQRN